jgi:uncharacterized coiled-coil protein SlyX
VTSQPFRSLSDDEQLAGWLGERLDRMEERIIMALSDSVANVVAVFTDLIADLNVTLTKQAQTLAAMSATIDRLTTEGTAKNATIQQLTDQVASMTADNTAAVDKLDALAEAGKRRTQPIDQAPA